MSYNQRVTFKASLAPPTDQHVVKFKIIKHKCERLRPGPFSSSSSSLGLETRLDMHIQLLVTNGKLLLEL